MAFTAVGNFVVGLASSFTTIGAAFAAGAYGVAALGAMAAIGAAYVTSRVINGNSNKGNNSARNEGGRIQVAPATNNKIPVIYGNAYVNGAITDARLSTLDQKDNNVMFYCIVLGETTNNINTTYGLEGVYWNDLRLSALSTTSTESHVVKDGRKVVDGAIFTAGAFVVDKTYVITKLGTTTQAQWNTIAGTSASPRVYGVGSVFQAATTGASSGTGQAQIEDFIDENFIVGTNQNVMMRVYAGGSTAADQIFPTNANNKANAYNFWGSTPANPNGDGSWTSANEMKGLIFAIIKLRYDGSKGFTSLPNVTFNIANNVTNPADVWLDYMTSERYGAGIDPSYIDEAARLDWYNFCEEDISYTGVNLDPQGGAGTTNQATSRYSINGVIDTSNQVKTNIDTILQNGGAWMSYNVDTGLWSPVIKKAVSAGIEGDTATYFTASRTSNTLTIPLPTTPLPKPFPSGRIEAGQLLYNSSNTLIGTITAQLAPTAGETAGQIGRYTTSAGPDIGSTTFYTLPASTLEFSDDNIISGISISSTRLEDLYNQVEVEFYNKYNKDQKAYFRNNLDEADRNPNEPDNQLRMSLDLCNNSMQADILGQMELRQSRDDLVIEFTSTHYGIQAQGGDVIAVTSELYGWYPKYFRVMRVKEIEGDDGSLVANIQALEYNPDAYTVEAISEFSTAANIGIGVYGASPNLPLPPSVVIASVDADAPIPNFQLQIGIPATGGPFDEIELYYTEGWDQHPITGSIVPGTGSNGAAVGQGLLTITNTTYGNINPGDRIDLLAPAADIFIVSQLTNNPVSKTFVSGGAPASPTSTLITLNNVTGLIVGNTLTGPGILNGSFIIEIDAGTNTVRIEDAVIVQAGSFTSTGSTISGTTLTIGTLSTGSIVIGQTLTGTGVTSGTKITEKISTGSGSGSTWKVSASQTVTSTAITGTSIYAVTGGLGTYIVDTSTTISGTADLYDFPEADNYKPLKVLVPEGNDPTYTNGSIVTDVITNVPANSATYRRWFVIARMGIKKRFGAFSNPGDVDFTQGRFPYNPNPVASGSLDDLTDVSITSASQGQLLVYNATTSKWNNEYEVKADTIPQTIKLTKNATTADDDFESEVNLIIEKRITDAASNATNDGGPSIQYARSFGTSGGTTRFGQVAFDYFGTTLKHKFAVRYSTDDFFESGGIYPNTFDLITSTPDATNINQGRLYVDATNNRVGINNTGPSYELHVNAAEAGPNDNVQFALTNSERSLIISNDAQFNLLTFQYDSANRLQFNLTDQWFNSGKLGINNSSPGYTLDVTGDARITLDAVISGDLTVNGTTSGGAVADIATTNTSGAIFNTNATTLDIGGAASTLNIGANSGTMTIGNPTVRGTQTTQNLYNTVATTLNIGGASTATNIGSTVSGTTTIGYDLFVNRSANIETSLTVPSISTLTGDDLSITAFSGRDVTISTTAAADPVTIVRNTTATNTAVRALTLQADTSATPAIGFGNALEYEVDTPAGIKAAAYISVNATNVTAGDESFNMAFGLMNSNDPYSTVMQVDSLGNLQIDGTLEIDGNQISSSSATAITLSGDDVAVVGGLNVNSGVLYVDKTNNRVGVNNTSPTKDLDVTGEAKISSEVTIGNTSTFSNVNYQEVRFETYNFNANTSVPTNVGIDLFVKATYRSARYSITMTKGSDYQVINLTIIHDGTTAYLSQSDDIKTGASDLATFSVSVDSTHVVLTANVNGTVNFKWYRWLTETN